MHSPLKEVPRARFERERLLLKPLAEQPYVGVVSTSCASAEELLPRVLAERRSLAAYGLLGDVGR